MGLNPRLGGGKELQLLCIFRKKFMDFREYRSHDAVGLAKLVRSGEISAENLLDIAIARHKQVNPTINAVVTELFEFARDSAKKINKEAPFCGVPFLMKDLGLQIKGTRYTNASRIQKDYISTETSTVAQKILDSGLLVMGKSNTSEFGTSPFVESELYGPARNPWNTKYTTGGSSGGSAAAVAAGIVPLATANDGGGSIRIPASCNGLMGLKPSRLRVSHGPQDGLTWSGAANHELCVSRSVRDTAQYLDVVMGNSIGDPYILQKPDMPYMKAIEIVPRKLKIAYSDEHPFNEQDPENVAAIKHTIALLKDAGHEVEQIAIPYDSKLVRDCLYTLVMGELSATIDHVAAMQGKKAHIDDIEPTNWLLYILGKNLSANEFCQAKLQWNVLCRQMEKFHQKYDILLTPTLGMRPFEIGALQPKPWELTALKSLNKLGMSGLLKHSSLIEDTKEKIFKWMPYPALANLTGQPCVSLPLYQSTDGLPIGVMFTAPFGDEATLLQLSRQLEDIQPWLQNVPKI
jgi:amidase